MNHTPQTTSPLSLSARILRDHPKRWLIPAVGFAALAGVFALVWPDTWEASQALILRNEAASGQDAPGRFVQPDQMKTFQETILELVKSHGVLSAALQEIGPAPGQTPSTAVWPDPQHVADLRDAVKLTPPKGAEFGKTEVFYLKVRDRDPRRAMALADAICGQLHSAIEKVRDDKARSMIRELEKAVELSEADLRRSTGKLSELERQVGSDLAELRMLHESNSGESVLRRTATEIRAELRQVQAAEKSNEQLLALLKQAQTEPERLVATPSTLLDSQSALKKLRDGLVDAQLNTAQLQGRMSSEHPLVIAARHSQDEIRRRVHGELANATRAIDVDLRLGAQKAAMLREQLAEVNARLDALAALRAPYANQAAETRKRSELLDRAAERLADARASQATAGAASLISRIDGPDAGTRPIGLGRATIVLLGLVAGLFAGFGIIILTVDPTRPDAGQANPGQPDSAQSSPASHGAALPGHNGNGNGCHNGRPAQRGLSIQEALKRLARTHP